MVDSHLSATNLRSLIGGVYMIAAWYEDDGGELRPPLAAGRFVLVDGQVVSLLHKTNRDRSTETQALFGRYVIEDGTFSYGYDLGWQVTRSPDGATAVAEVRTDLMRFEATRPAEVVELRNADGRLGFDVTPGTIKFIDNGHLRRIWQRAKA